MADSSAHFQHILDAFAAQGPLLGMGMAVRCDLQIAQVKHELFGMGMKFETRFTEHGPATNRSR